MATSLSAGLIVHDILSNDEGVMGIATRVFPVLTDQSVDLPYVCYHRERMEHLPTKQLRGVDTTHMVVTCYAAKYDQSVALAEAVREALEYKEHAIENVPVDDESSSSSDDSSSGDTATLGMWSCTLVDSSEFGNEEGNYVQELTFLMRIY